MLDRRAEYDPVLQGWWLCGEFCGLAQVRDPGGRHKVEWLAAFRLADAVSRVRAGLAARRGCESGGG